MYRRLSLEKALVNFVGFVYLINFHVTASEKYMPLLEHPEFSVIVVKTGGNLSL